MVSIACTKPKDHGLAAELWSISALARFVCEGAESAGHSRLAQAGKSTVWRILNEHDIKPHKIRYYLERRDPEFDRKMQEVLLVYRDVSIYSDGAVHDGRPNPIYTVSVDEKPGVQALGLTAPDLPPVPGKAATVARDYEYVRHGTVSILAGIDLHSGHIFARTEDRHRSIEFIALLKDIDAYYPPDAIIRVVLDNHSAHISKETMAFLATRPGRFEYVHTPKHGSWLNLIECAFSKMARTFLRHIRVASLDELKTRILKGVDEMNQLPVVFRWNKFDIGITMYAIRRHRAAVKAWCWRVRFSRRGVMYSRAFFDLVCGGPKEAKAQAVAWRDAQLANLKALTLVEFHERHRSNNVSGMPGVHFHKTARQPLGFWQAKIRFHDGKSRAKAFSVRLHGYEEAFRLAVAARTELLAQVESRPYLHHSVAKRLCRQR